MDAPCQHESESPNVPAEPIHQPSLEELAAEYRKQAEHWEASGSAQILSQVFEQELSLFPASIITQCVCIGLGRLISRMTWQGPREGAWYEESTAPLHQLVFLRQLLGLLRKKHNIQGVSFQDPTFTEVERAFLLSLGYKVFLHPKAFEVMHPTTFVFAPRFRKDLVVGLFRIAHPALYIGTDIDEAIAFAQIMDGTSDPIDNTQHQQMNVMEEPPRTPLQPATQYTIDLLVRFREATAREPMPVFDKHQWCRDSAIYWLQQQERQDTSPAEGKTARQGSLSQDERSLEWE